MSTPVTATSLAATVAAMKRAHIQDGPASAELRQDRLSRAMTLLSTHHRELVAAVNADFGHRAAYQTLAADIMSSLGALRHAREQLTQWMQPEEQPAPAPGMQARIQYQPLGVVGIISPWNFPINLAFSPLAGVLAAGNRALIKPSELTPRTSALMGELIARYFDPMEIGTVLGDASVGAAFSGQAFDHLIFTGGTNVGRQVMRAAAENLVPVTLELGGKSPVLVDTDADLQTAAERILTVKTFNAGQICIAPDYVMLPASAQDAFVTHARAFVSRVFPALHTNPDYTAIISERHFQRLQALLDDARAQGATVVELPIGQHVAAIAAGQIDGAYTLEPTGTIGRLNGTSRVLEAGVISQYVLGNNMAPWFGGSASLSSDFIKKNPDAAKKFIAAYAKGVAYVRTKPVEARKYLTGYTPIEGALAGEVPLAAYTMHNEFTPADIGHFQKFFDLFSEKGIFSSRLMVDTMIYKG